MSKSFIISRLEMVMSSRRRRRGGSLLIGPWLGSQHPRLYPVLDLGDHFDGRGIPKQPRGRDVRALGP